jgi:hypothetical protein
MPTTTNQRLSAITALRPNRGAPVPSGGNTQGDREYLAWLYRLSGGDVTPPVITPTVADATFYVTPSSLPTTLTLIPFGQVTNIVDLIEHPTAIEIMDLPQAITLVDTPTPISIFGILP